MTKLVGLHPEQIPLEPPEFVIPGKGAIHMPPPDEGYQTNPSINGLPGNTKIQFTRNPRVQYQRNSDARGLMFSDFYNRAVSGRNYWYLNRYPNNTVVMPLSTYSCRLYYTFNGGPETTWPESFPHIITFMQGNSISGVDRFSLMLWEAPLFQTALGNRPFIKGATNAINLTTPVAGQMFSSWTYRIEIQVQPTAPKVTIKIYQWNSTTPWRTLITNPTDVAADCFMLGRHPQKSGGPNLVGNFWVGDVEVFNTYNLDGTVGTHRQTPRNQWFEMVAGAEVPVEEEGVMSGGVLDTSDKWNFHDNDREFVYDPSNYTSVSFFYDPPRTVRGGLLYYPTRPAPPGGWPLISFYHGGFFAAGALTDVNMNWVLWLLYLGYAVSTTTWILGRAMIDQPVSLGVWPAQNSGRYPSFYIDPKLFALHMIAKGQQGDGTYPINTDKMCITGHSAGGAIALGAAVSRDVTINGYDLSVNNPNYGYRTGTADPTFKCCYVWSPPTDMKWAADNDPTDPDYGLVLLVPQLGIIKATANTYMGFTATTTLTNLQMVGTRISEMVSAQTTAKLPPVGIVTGINDGVVPHDHTRFFVEAMSNKGLSVDQFYSNKDHDKTYLQGPQLHFLRFLEDNDMAPNE